MSSAPRSPAEAYAAHGPTPREQYEALKKDFDAAKADHRVIEYPGAVHAFTNPQANDRAHGMQYDATADKRSVWRPIPTTIETPHLP